MHPDEHLEFARACLPLEPRISAIPAGTERPTNAEEKATIAQICYYKQLYAPSARFWKDALAEKPALGENFIMANRYNAACSMALASAGESEGQGNLNAAARRERLKQALEWLKADLAHRVKQAKSGDPLAKAEARQALEYWKGDPDLAGIRD